MAILTGNRPAPIKIHRLVAGHACKWCGKPATGFACRGLGDWKFSCGSCGQLFQAVPPGRS